MSLKSIQIEGFRGITSEVRIEPAIPSNQIGSGITLLVGGNGAGKSTTIEVVQCLQRREPIGMGTLDIRNFLSQGRLRVAYRDDADNEVILGDALQSGGEIGWQGTVFNVPEASVWVVPSRRSAIPPTVNGPALTGRNQGQRLHPGASREANRYGFEPRLLDAERNRAQFDVLFAGILGDRPPGWRLVQTRQQGQAQFRYYSPAGQHGPEGMPDGLVSLFSIVDALVDSSAGDLIAIDEPEASLPPSMQRRLAKVLGEFAATRQIIVATHSPHFIDWEWLGAGAAMIRLFWDENVVRSAALSRATAVRLAGIAADRHNPHVLGPEAREILFADDGVVLVEGQEDVIGYGRIARDLGMEIGGAFFGWGVGGAEKMSDIAAALRDLGYSRVVGVLDADKSGVAGELGRDYRDYSFIVSPETDIRDKYEKGANGEPRLRKKGLLDSNWKLKAECFDSARKLLSDVEEGLK